MTDIMILLCLISFVVDRFRAIRHYDLNSMVEGLLLVFTTAVGIVTLMLQIDKMFFK